MIVNELSAMVGATIAVIDGELGNEEMVFCAVDGRRFRFVYYQDCCASCRVEDICGDLDDLIGSPIVLAEEVSNYDAPAPENADSYTWTFYRFGTAKGTVTVRWLGESNGYYSESVTFEVLPSPQHGTEGEDT